jgi:predicted aspartyl protease
VTIDTGAYATVARPDIVAGLPERELSQPYVLQTASGETIPVVQEAHVELIMGRRTLRSWVFVADIKDDFILGLDIICVRTTRQWTQDAACYDWAKMRCQ